jgi:hypothetical protein
MNWARNGGGWTALDIKLKCLLTGKVNITFGRRPINYFRVVTSTIDFSFSERDSHNFFFTLVFHYFWCKRFFVFFFSWILRNESRRVEPRSTLELMEYFKMKWETHIYVVSLELLDSVDCFNQYLSRTPVGCSKNFVFIEINKTPSINRKKNAE